VWMSVCHAAMLHLILPSTTQHMMESCGQIVQYVTFHIISKWTDQTIWGTQILQPENLRPSVLERLRVYR
jgi:hypothetical protein